MFPPDVPTKELIRSPLVPELSFSAKPSAKTMTRRLALGLAGCLAAAFVALLPGQSFAQRAQGPAEVPVDELMKPGQLPDFFLGPADAKVTVVEYASLTCPHCANFENKVFPELKKKYIESGKVRYLFRGFALNPLDQAAQILVQCVDLDKRQSMIEAFYEKQADWAFSQGNPVPKLFDIAKQAGFTQESFDKCLKDQSLLDKLDADRKHANETFGVSSTPTFFINGKRLQVTPTIEAFDGMIEPLLK
jgi:protein-disulfide isomerase